jgi:hypothetical protein
MNFNIKIFLLCPVPEDQKPINQYINMKENNLLNWTMFSFQKYIFQIISGFSFLVPLFLICFLNFTPFSLLEIGKIFAISSALFFLLLYLRWSDMNQRLVQARVFYEEASWFDGKIWDKPFFLIKNDKLLSTQKIEPIRQRLFYTLVFHLIILFVLLNS